MTFELWSNTQLFDTTEKLMARVENEENDKAQRPEMDAELADSYNALADPSFRDCFGVIDAAIDSHIAVTDSMQSRAELLDAMMAEYERRIAMAMKASRTFCRSFVALPAERLRTLNLVFTQRTTEQQSNQAWSVKTGR